MFALPNDQMNYVINCLIAKSTWDDLILYHEEPSDVKESRVMDLKLCYNTFKFKEGESLTQTFTRYKALMNELVNDGIKLSMIEINTDFINVLPKKWLAFCVSLRNTNHVKESELASLFGKLKYEENLIDNIYETDKEKTLVSATPLSTAFLSTSIIQDFQDSPDDEEDTRSNHEYMNDLEEEYQTTALLAKSKRFYKKGSSASSPKSSSGKNKGLITETYEWDKEEVSSDENEAIEVKDLMELVNEERVSVSKESASNETWLNSSNKVNHCIIEQIPTQRKKTLGINKLTEDTSSSGPKDPVFVKSSVDNSEVSITSSNKPKLSKAEDSSLSTQDTATDYDLADESSVCSTPFLYWRSWHAKPVPGPKTIKSNLKSNPTFKAETLKGITLKEHSSTLVKDNKKGSSASKTSSAPAGKLKNVKVNDDLPLDIVMKELNKLKLKLIKKKSSHFRNHQPQ
nr:retrovirus-related Pol polyprotein from transposon TNT 1-94 [Tanacetum cinerariifolium]